MRNDTRLAFNQYCQTIANLNGVPNAFEKFSVSPTVTQTLETKIQESSAFLGQINIIGVPEQMGEKLGLGIGGPAASRTDTETKDRTPRDLTSLDGRGYVCVQTNFDTKIKYKKLDAWAKFKDFQTRIRDLIIQRQALDRMIIGFHGTHAAPETSIATYPLLQDVNVGWLESLRAQAPARVMASGKVNGEVSYGVGSDYKNLDSMAYDALQLLDPWYRDDPNLRVFLGADLLHDKYFPLVDKPEDPTEVLAADIIISQKRVGGKQAVQVPFFPAGTMLITTFENLSIYWQENTRRRQIVDNAKRDQIENYESSNDAYVVEQLGKAALIEKIVHKEA